MRRKRLDLNEELIFLKEAFESARTDQAKLETLTHFADRVTKLDRGRYPKRIAALEAAFEKYIMAAEYEITREQAREMVVALWWQAEIDANTAASPSPGQ
jgi:hypothetical protein